MPQGKGSQLHNRRDYEKIGRAIPDNINPGLSEENIILMDRDIKEAYREIFGESLREYNQKQKRKDRQINDYYEHISKSKNGEKLFYEDVLQWGKKEDFEKNPELRAMAADALTAYALNFEKRNPNLKLIGAYIHMDEASPHLHLDYIPVAHGYSRGLKTRNSLARAMREMGFNPESESRKNNSTMAWKENERNYFKKICEDFGLEVEAERKARGSLSVDEYKEAREQMLGELEEEVEDLRFQERELSGLLVKINDETNKQAIFLERQDEKIDKLEKTISSLQSEKKQLDQELEVSNMQLEEKNNAIKEREVRLEALEGALEPIKGNRVNVTSITLRNGLKKENKTVVEGMTPSEVEKVFKLAEIVKKAYKIIQNAKDEAYEILKEARINKHKLEKEIEELKKEHFTWSTAKSDIQLRKIKEEHPEMFDKQGLYISKNEREQNNLIIRKRDKGDR